MSRLAEHEPPTRPLLASRNRELRVSGSIILFFACALCWSSTSAPRTGSASHWWYELDKTKYLVLVTQGTIANRDFGQLIEPTLTGLSRDKDLMVMATTGGQSIECISVDIPANARVAEFMPFEQIMPSVDLLITNGGCGTVNMA
jgi:UDP:flavonoid glycosyltransferase YjiC (YdhE family)